MASMRGLFIVIIIIGNLYFIMARVDFIIFYLILRKKMGLDHLK